MTKRPNYYALQISLTPFALDFLEWVSHNCEGTRKQFELLKNRHYVASVRHLIGKGFITSNPEENPVYRLTEKGRLTLEFKKLETRKQ
jgi:hypothetical protein